RSGHTLPAVWRSGGGLSARTAISREIMPQSAASVACHVPAAGVATSANQKYGGPPCRSRDAAATLPSGATSENSPCRGFSAAKMTRNGAPFHGPTGDGRTAISASSSQLRDEPWACESPAETARANKVPATSDNADAAAADERARSNLTPFQAPSPTTLNNMGKPWLNHGKIRRTGQWFASSGPDRRFQLGGGSAAVVRLIPEWRRSAPAVAGAVTSYTRSPGQRQFQETSAGCAQETTFAQEVPNLGRRVPVERERMQAVQDDVIALARQGRRCERDGVIPRRRDHAEIEIRRRREPVHVTVSVRAELHCGEETLAEQAQRQLGELRPAIGRREQHDAAELSRPPHRERAPHDDGPHAVADEMKPLDARILVEFLGLG